MSNQQIAIATFGWPSVEGVTSRIASVIDTSSLTGDQLADFGPTLASVILEFQAPPPRGTGRTWQPVTETRVFDGNGMPEFRVPEIVPGSDFSVSFWGTPQADVVLKSDYRGNAYEVLAKQSSYAFGYGGYGALSSSVFPIGRQNISVTTTWGYAATVPYDVADAVACEVAARLLIATQGGVRGVPQSEKLPAFEISQSGEVSKATSVILSWQARYRETVRQYSDDGLWKTATLKRRMS